MRTGRLDQYFWLETSPDRAEEGPVLQALDALRECSPDVVRGKHIVVTAFDSGPFVPGEAEQEAGWTVQNKVAVSPRVADIWNLPAGEFDEWYVFGERPKFPLEHEVFVNYHKFSLTGGEEWHTEALQRFWRQLGCLHAESYIAAGDRFIFVTRERSLFESACACMARHGF